MIYWPWANAGKVEKCNRRAKRKADSELTSRNRSVYLISPPPVSNTSPIDNVDPPDSVLTIDESDRIFSDNNDDSDEVKIVFQDTQESDSDTIQYLPSPTYHLSPSSDVTTQRLTPRLTPTSTPGSTTRSSIRCITFDLSDIRANPLSEVRWSDSNSD